MIFCRWTSQRQVVLSHQEHVHFVVCVSSSSPGLSTTTGNMKDARLILCGAVSSYTLDFVPDKHLLVRRREFACCGVIVAS